MKHLFKILIVYLVILSSCDKGNDAVPEFPINYKVIVNDYDAEFSNVSFYAHTYFPIENETIIKGFGKFNNLDFRDEYYLKTYDTLTFTPSLSGYKGCQTYLEVRINYKDNVAKLKEIYVLYDTLEVNNGKISFEWPEDTVLY